VNEGNRFERRRAGSVAYAVFAETKARVWSRVFARTVLPLRSVYARGLHPSRVMGPSRTVVGQANDGRHVGPDTADASENRI